MKYLRLLLPLVILVIGIQFFLDHVMRSPGDIKNLEELLQRGKKVEGVYERYEYLTYKGKQISESYIIEYSYVVKGKNYRGRENTHQIPSQKAIEITYLQEDPSISSINPNASLSFQKGLDESQLGLWIGLGGILLGSFLLYTRIKKLVRKTA